MEQQSITDILNTDYKAYARYTVESRAIPHFVDGFKTSQRKAMAAAMANCKNRALNVSALSGKVKGDFDYHHGDTSIQQAIIVMNQPWKQGMPYLDKVGQFGWLYDPVAGAPRYISTKLSGWSQLLFKDDAELQYNFNPDTGDKIEPQYYLPILPMLLINGTNGIAVGYSTSFVNRNPLEITLAVKEYLETGDLKPYNLTPFVLEHTGIWSYWNGKFEHCAPWHRKNTTVLCIDGLPLSTTLEKYRSFLNSLIEQNLIVRYADVSRKGECKFEVHMKQSDLDRLIAENGVAGFFNLIYTLPNDNMTCVMPDKSIKRFESPIQFIKEFVDFRLMFYTKRKRRLIHDLQSRIKYLQDLIRFIQLVLNNEITFKGKRKSQLEAELRELAIDRAVLNVQIYNLTEDNIAKHVHELEHLNKELVRVQNTTERQMYIDDINELLPHVQRWYKIEPVLNLKHEHLLRIAEPID